MTRRKFLQNTTKAIVTIPFISMAVADILYGKTRSFKDYKAIVILNFNGGNDSLNMFIPTNETKHNDYHNARKKISIANVDLINDTTYTKDTNGYYRPLSKSNNPYKATAPTNPSDIEPQDNLEAIYRKGMYKFESLGINGMMPEIASLYEKNILSMVSNVGTLVEPTIAQKVKDKDVELPLFLFAHDHQKRAIQTAYAQDKINTGWLGRLADNWSPINDTMGLNISLDGTNTMLVGKSSSPLSFGNAPDTYSNNVTKNIIDKFSQTSDNNVFESLYKRLNLQSKQFSDKFDGVWNDVVDFSSFKAKNSYGDDLFTTPSPEDIGIEESIHQLDDKLFKDLETVAKLIKLGNSSFGYKRQTFYVSLGGFDFHSSQPKDHLQKLRSISLACSDFYKALEEMNLHDKVVLATTSDFGRSLLSNGDGTDHGWGGHNFILSGADEFIGGKILGNDINSYNLKTSNDFYPQKNRSKGRLIPTTSIEQMFSPILDWFGVDEMIMAKSFPNLINFKTNENDYKSAFLKDVFI
jgi:uncharacterized protein (DUF1501 family)